MIGPELTTGRLTLKALDPVQLGQAYVDWLADSRVNQYLETRHSEHSLASVRAFVEEINASDHSVLFGVFPRATGAHIGNIKLGPIDRRNNRADIGLLIGDPAEWGKGYAAEMIGAVTRYGLEDLGLNKLTAGCYAANEGSRRAFLSNGWREVGRSRDHWRVGEGWMDNVILEIVGGATTRPCPGAAP